MAKKKVVVNELSNMDKVENFLQNYFKQILLGIGLIIIIFIISYIIFNVISSSKDKKIDVVSQAEMTLNTDNGITNFQNLSKSVSFLKDYIIVKSAEAWVMNGKKEEALKDIVNVSGKYKEIGDGLAFDLGATINPEQFIKNGDMKPLWYYRLIITSKENREKYIEEFRQEYPDSKLLELIENWGL